MQSYRRAILTSLLVCLFAGLAAEAPAAPPLPRKKSILLESDGFLSFGVGYLDGDTAYRIGVYDPPTGGAVESELQFLLNAPLLVLETGYITKDKRARDAWKFSLSFSTDMGGSSGKLRDSDWLNDVVDTALVGSPNPGKDIYSESSTDMNVRIADLRITRSFWPSDSVAVGPLAGFLYETFDFTARDVVQVGYGPYASTYSGTLPGKVLSYSVAYTIPYAGVHAEIPAGRQFHMVVDLGYSPWVTAEDEDDHMLRTKKAKGNASGSAWLASIAAQWDLEDKNSISVRGDYRKIDTKGTQMQYWYGNTAGEPPAGTALSGISDRITSNQHSLVLLVTSRF